MEYKKQSLSFGFTIVELLVVIVVIGILATITIVSYTGIQGRAIIVSLISDLDNASKQLKLFQVDNGNYPTTIDCSIPDSSTNKCIKASSGNTYQYAVSNSTNPQSFCVKTTNDLINYKIASDSTPSTGNCLSYGLVVDLDAGNSASYPGSGTTWTDLSGNNNGTLMNGATYSSANGGTFIFDGIDDYVNIAHNDSLMPQSISVCGWIRLDGSSNWMLVNKAAGGTSGSYYIYGGSPSSATWSIFSASGGRHDVSFTSLTVGSWYYLVGTFDSISGVMKSYLNGVLKGTTSNASLGYNTANVLVGKYTSGYQVNGAISDIRIYSRSLSAEETMQNYNALKGRYGL